MDKNKSKIEKVVLIILVIVVLIIIVMMFIVGKKIKILKDLDNKVSSLEDNNNNIYMKTTVTTMVSKIEGNISTSESFIKDDVCKVSLERKNADGSNYNLVQMIYPEERKLFIDNNGTKTLNLYKEKVPIRNSHIKEDMESSYVALPNYAIGHTFLQILFLSIEDVTMDEKECYKIECKNATTRKVCWIEKETGLGVMSISYNKINGIEYESELSKKEVVFGTVTDEDLIEPDMSQYTIQE